MDLFYSKFHNLLEAVFRFKPNEYFIFYKLLNDEVFETNVQKQPKLNII